MGIELGDPPTREQEEAFVTLDISTIGDAERRVVSAPADATEVAARARQAAATMLLLTVQVTHGSGHIIGSRHAETVGMVSRVPLSETLRQLAAYEDAFSVARAPLYLEHRLLAVATVPAMTSQDIDLARVLDLQYLAATVSGDAA